MPEKKKKIIAFSDTLHILFETNMEIEEPERRKIRVSREKTPWGRGGGGEARELMNYVKKNIQTFIINSTLYCLSLAFGLNGFAHIPPII